MKIQTHFMPRFAARPANSTPQQIQQITDDITQHLTSQRVVPGSFNIKVYQMLPHIDVNVTQPDQLADIRTHIKTLPGIQKVNQKLYYQNREVSVAFQRK